MRQKAHWEEWDGTGYPAELELVYFSFGEIDTKRGNESKELVSTLLRDGVVDTRSDGFSALDSAKTVWGRVLLFGDDQLLSYDAGDADYESDTPVRTATWVEMNLVNNN